MASRKKPAADPTPALNAALAPMTELPAIGGSFLIQEDGSVVANDAATEARLAELMPELVIADPAPPETPPGEGEPS